MNDFSKRMIVQSEAVNKSCWDVHAHVLLTNKTDEELKAGPMPPMSVPECEVLPLAKNLDELWKDNSKGQLSLNCTDGDEVTILTDERNSRNGYNYVGLVHAQGGDDVECWNRNGEPESGISEHKLASCPVERYGYIAIYKGTVSDHICESASDAIRSIKRQGDIGLDVELDSKDIFVLSIGCWVTDDEEERVI